MPTQMVISPADALETLIEEGRFASKLEAYINRTFRCNGENNWYKNTLKASGYDAAERELADWLTRGYDMVYASSIEPVARGIAALAKVKEDCVVDITGCTSRVGSDIDAYYGPRHKFVVNNFHVPETGNVQSSEDYAWSPHGQMKLRAVVLETGYARTGAKSEMTLVLPAWGCDDNAPRKGTVNLVQLGDEGTDNGYRYALYTVNDGAVTHVTDPMVALDDILGQRPLDNVRVDMRGGDLDGMLGFPGAENYLAKMLPRLGRYFELLAGKLAATQE